MINIETIKKVYIHDGNFNTDDVVSSAIIKMANENITIERVSNKPELNTGEIYLSLAGKFEKYQLDEFGNRYSLSTYAFEWCIDKLFNDYEINNIEKAKEIFYERYIIKITTGTLKRFYCNSFFRENNILLRFNSEWYEEANGTTSADEQFFKAVDFMMIVLENWLKLTKEDADLREVEDEIWRRAEETQEDGIYILERHIPWQYQVRKDPETKAKIIIFKSNRGGYNIVSKSTDEIEIQESEYLSFIHPSKFMGVAENLNNAILAAKLTIQKLETAV